LPSELPFLPCQRLAPLELLFPHFFANTPARKGARTGDARLPIRRLAVAQDMAPVYDKSSVPAFFGKTAPSTAGGSFGYHVIRWRLSFSCQSLLPCQSYASGTALSTMPKALPLELL
jgi:hypothetical protein